MDLPEQLANLSVTPGSLSSLTSSEQDELISLLEAERIQRARRNFLSFVTSIDVPGAPVRPDDDDCDEFYPESIKPAQHHKLICEVLQKVADGKLRRVMIFAPPGSGKSIYTSVCFPPFMMGRKRRSNIISVSYGSDLARKFGRRCRSIARSDSFKTIFDCGLSAESSAADEWALSNESEYMSGGILSGVTGNRADGLLIDDPVRGLKDADSAAFQSSTWDAYVNDLVTRLKPSAWQILMMTRWNERDLGGQILPDDYDWRSGFVRGKDGHDWFVVCLPFQAEREDDPLGRKIGDCLWPEYLNVADILKIKAAPHLQRTWMSLYQQRPKALEGSYFKREWFKFCKLADIPKHLTKYGASDYAVTKGGGDFTVHGVAGVDPNDDIYIIDLWRKQELTNVSTDVFLDMVDEHKPLAWARDRDQIVNSIGPFVTKRMQERGIYCACEDFAMGREDKEMRAQSIRARAAQGKIYLPIDAPWFEALMSELLAFSSGRHDDQVDMLGLLGRLMDTMVSGYVPQQQEPRNTDDYVSAQGYEDAEESWKTA